MYVCICKQVTDSQVEDSVVSGANTVRDLSRSTGLGTQCGKCVCFARERIQHHRSKTQKCEFYAA